MRIDVALKLRPFSHTIGCVVCIPHTSWRVQIFCTKLLFQHAVDNKIYEVDLPLQGLIRNFLVELDMEKGILQVRGRDERAFFRYTIGVDGVSFAKGENISLSFIKKETSSLSPTKVSFGVSKKQDWDLIVRRADKAEYFPFLFKLASLFPFVPSSAKPQGTEQLLKEDKFDLFFHTALYGLMVPSFEDRLFTGLVDEPKGSPNSLSLIHAMSQEIVNLFFQEKDTEIHFLPHLPKELHAGRWKDILTKEGDRIDFLWSKKKMKQVKVTPGQTRSLVLIFPKNVKTCRIRSQLNQRGECYSLGTSLDLVKGKPLYLDRFTS